MIEETFQQAFAADGLNVSLSFSDLGEDLDESEALEVIGGKIDKFHHVIQVRQDIDYFLSEYANDSAGIIKHGRFNMITYGIRPKATAQDGLTWLQLIWNSACGELGQFGREFVYQNLLRIFRYHPVGGAQRFSSKWGGKLWKNIQNIEFAAAEV